MLWLALAFVLAVAVAGCLLVADLLGQVLTLWQERPPSVRWLNAGAAGQGVLAAAAICVLVAGVRRPGWRRGTVLAEVLIVLVAFGWFFLTTWLQRRALPPIRVPAPNSQVCSACLMIDIEMPPIPNGGS
jgi:hypothetical protein